MIARLELWVMFGIAISAMLFLDLFVINRRSHAVSVREALKWVIVWTAAALVFCLGIHILLGKIKAFEFLTGYIVEESLSFDNLFIFLVIFEYFSIPHKYRPRVLKWGIIGAIIMRAIFITVGVGLFRMFDWVIYIFGAFLVFTALKLALRKEERIEPEKNPVLRFFKRYFRVTGEFHEDRFFFLHSGIWSATPLFAVLILIESSDLIFATDSVPAVLSITTDPFIVYTSNIFAILGLRSLFFVISGMMGIFRYFKTGISVVLGFVGVKMLLSHVFKIPVTVSLVIVFSIFAVSILASVIHKEKEGTLDA